MTSPLDSYKEFLEDICAEWAQAEADIKLAEQIAEKVIFPAVKELRYGGRRIAQALQLILSNGNPDEINKYLQDALFDCHRARHDAIDAAAAQMAIVARIAEDKLGPDAVLSAFPEFPSLVEQIQNLRSKIVNSRRSAAEREAIYVEIESADFPKVVDLYNKFQRSEERMKAIARKQRVRDAVSYASLFVGFAGMALAVWALIK